MKISIETSGETYAHELEDVVRAFEPFTALAPDGEKIFADVTASGSVAETIIKCKNYPNVSRKYDLEENLSPLLLKRQLKRFLKRDFYDFLSSILKRDLSYGSLTGIRPTKLYYELIEEKKDPEEELKTFFRVSEEKARLVKTIVETQKGIYGEETDQYDFFVNIPFCPSRCHYCSFLSEVINPKKGNLPLYVDALIRDILSAVPKRKRRAIYVGGGTPTSLSPDLLDRVLAAIDAKGEEFTVEAGRPETLTPEKVAVMAARGVTRVSVNPQTFKQETLDLIGRHHTVEDINRAYGIVRDGGSFDVNMDFITMLPGESFEDFRYSLDQAIDLAPENITVHSLSIKRGSIFAEKKYDNFSDTDAERMSSYAMNTLEKAGYSPYYMYRQKNTTGRLENVGYAKKGKICKYNVDIMEETHDVYASGAGAISKRIFGDGLIKRLAEVKDIKGYLERIDEILAKKIDFFKD